MLFSRANKNEKPSSNHTEEIRLVQFAQSRPRYWMIALFVLSIFYLIPEIIFNAALVQVAGSADAPLHVLEAVELFGRSISGIGVTLLLADLLLRGRLLASPLRAIGSFLLLLIVVWPLVFFGQRYLVDEFIVNVSTAEQRQRAYFSQVLRTALAHNNVEIDGIPYDPDHAPTPSELTFLALFGGMVYADPKLVERLESKAPEIVQKHVAQQAYADFPHHYKRYQAFRKQLQDAYREYANNSNDYNSARDNAQARANTAWQEVQDQVLKGWGNYQQAVKAFDARTHARAQEITPKLSQYFEGIGKCTSDSCRTRWNKGYDDNLKRYDIGYVSPDYWLTEETVSKLEKFSTSLIAGVLTGGVYTLVQGIDMASGGNGGMPDKRYYFINDVDSVRQKIQSKMESEFSKSAKGYPYGLTSLEAFRGHTLTAQNVRRQVNKNHQLGLADSWHITDRAGFDKAVTRRVYQQTDARWKAANQERNLSLPPNLSWSEFQKHQDIQQRIKNEMGSRYYVKPMMADWNNKTFLTRVVEPNIKRETESALNSLRAQVVEFEDGGKLENASKTALRSIIVPPISMAVSLFLIISTLIKLPQRFWEIGRARQPKKTLQQKMTGIVLFKMLPLAAVILVPILWMPNKYLDETSTVNYFIERVEENASAFSSGALYWVMAAQPRFHPLGETLEYQLGLMDSFYHVSPALRSLDDRVFAMQIQP